MTKKKQIRNLGIIIIIALVIGIIAYSQGWFPLSVGSPYGYTAYSHFEWQDEKLTYDDVIGDNFDFFTEKHKYHSTYGQRNFCKIENGNCVEFDFDSYAQNSKCTAQGTVTGCLSGEGCGGSGNYIFNGFVTIENLQERGLVCNLQISEEEWIEQLGEDCEKGIQSDFMKSFREQMGIPYVPCESRGPDYLIITSGTVVFEPVKEIVVYRLENNQCIPITILETEKTENDYYTLSECQKNLIKKINVYRLENNECTFMTILETERTENDYDTFVECQANIIECITDDDCERVSCFGEAKCEGGTCVLPSADLSPPCKGAVWKGMPDCKWDKSGCENQLNFLLIIIIIISIIGGLTYIYLKTKK